MTNHYLLALLVTLVLTVCGTTSQLDTDTDPSTIAKEAGRVNGEWTGKLLSE